MYTDDQIAQIHAAAQDALNKGADPTYVANRTQQLLGDQSQPQIQPSNPQPAQQAAPTQEQSSSPMLQGIGAAMSMVPAPGSAGIGGAIQAIGSMTPSQTSAVGGSELSALLGTGLTTLNLAKAGADILDSLGVKNNVGKTLGDTSQKAEDIFKNSDWYKTNQSAGDASLWVGKNALPLAAGAAVPVAKTGAALDMGSSLLNGLANTLGSAGLSAVQSVGNSPNNQADNALTGAIAGGLTYGALTGVGAVGKAIISEASQDVLSKIPVVGTQGQLRKQGQDMLDGVKNLTKQYATHSDAESAAYQSLLNKVGPDTMVPRDFSEGTPAYNMIQNAINKITNGQPITSMDAGQKVAYNDLMNFIKNKVPTSFANSWNELKQYGQSFGKQMKSEYNVTAPSELSTLVNNTKWALLKGQMEKVAQNANASTDWAIANQMHQKNIIYQSLQKLAHDSVNKNTGEFNLNTWANNATRFLDNNTPLAVQKAPQSYKLPTALKAQTQQAIQNIVQMIKQNPRAVKALGTPPKLNPLESGGTLAAIAGGLHMLGIPFIPATAAAAGGLAAVSKIISTPSAMEALGRIGSYGHDFKRASSMIINGLIKDQHGK